MRNLRYCVAEKLHFRCDRLFYGECPNTMNSDSDSGTSCPRPVGKFGRGWGYNRPLTGNGSQTHMDGRKLPSVAVKLILYRGLN